MKYVGWLHAVRGVQNPSCSSNPPHPHPSHMKVEGFPFVALNGNFMVARTRALNMVCLYIGNRRESGLGLLLLEGRVEPGLP